MDMECGRNVIDDPFVPKIVVENLHGLRDVVDTAIDCGNFPVPGTDSL